MGWVSESLHLTLYTYSIQDLWSADVSRSQESLHPYYQQLSAGTAFVHSDPLRAPARSGAMESDACRQHCAARKATSQAQNWDPKGCDGRSLEVSALYNHHDC